MTTAKTSLTEFFARKGIYAGLVAVLAFSGTAGAATDITSYTSAEFVANEVLVKYQPTISENMRASVLTGINVGSSKPLGTTGYHLVKLTDLSTMQAVNMLSGRDGVVAVQPNFIYHASLVPADTEYGQLWGLKNTAQSIPTGSYSTNNPGIAGNDMDAELAWNHITDCSNTTVAVLDTGVQYSHEDLSSNMWSSASYPNHGYDFIDNDNDPMDTHGHGTHVAGTIGARGNNGKGTTGVCWQASIMAVRVLGTSGSGSTAGIVQGVDFASANGAKVINMSLGGGGYDAAFNTAIANAGAAGVAVIVAAGNAGSNNDSTPAYPCSYNQPNLLCIAALDQAYSRASFSNYGLTSVDVGAPGTNIRSSWNATVAAVDDFSGWVKGGAWSVTPSGTPCSILGGTLITPLLTNPANWCNGANYAPSVNDVAYRNYTGLPGGGQFVVASYYLSINVASGDAITAAYSTTGDPFAGGTTLSSYFGNTGTGIIPFAYELPNCSSSTTCSFGLRLSGNGDGIVDKGIAAAFMELNVESNTAYNTINGTSMATPHVAGLATMLFAFNPDYTYSDVLAAIKAGGEDVTALSGITTTGKAVNAMGALAHIQTPTNVSAVIP